jgi:antitoxin component YwqK of YwqJK toxin-antitoxin module
MKQNLLLAIFCLAVYAATAQNTNRHIRFRSIGRDSLNLALDDGYFLIEDSCKQITRYSKFDFQQRKFQGKFTDVSTATPGLIVAEGTYTTDGLKDGLFVTHYLNGKLQAKGIFKNDKYDGPWEISYDNGNPELTFEVVNGVCRITNAWATDGKKTVDNGNGGFTLSLGQIYWKGKLLNGLPDGKWRLFNSEDITETPMATEYYKKGQFHDGSNGSRDYTDVSRIDFSVPVNLPFMNAENMYISPVSCDGSKAVHIVNAQYRNGLNNFSSYISQAVSPYFSTQNLAGMEVIIEIDGEISEEGSLINLKNNGSVNEGLSRQIIVRLAELPALQPATANGKPVKQKFTILFTISGGFYKFNYKFLPVKVLQ